MSLVRVSNEQLFIEGKEIGYDRRRIRLDSAEHFGGPSGGVRLLGRLSYEVQGQQKPDVPFEWLLTEVDLVNPDLLRHIQPHFIRLVQTFNA